MSKKDMSKKRETEDLESNQRQAIITEALTWLGTPYHSHARVKGAGVDCGLFIAEVFEHCGVIPHVDPGYYSPEWMLHHSEELYQQWVEKFFVKRAGRPPLPGDIIIYKFGLCRSHGAIVIDYPKIIHSYIHRGVIIDTAEASYLIDKEQDLYAAKAWANNPSNKGNKGIKNINANKKRNIKKS